MTSTARRGSTIAGPSSAGWPFPISFRWRGSTRSKCSQPARPPLFVFFPTISTHFPFSPTPPYQPDWPRMLTDTPYDGPAIVERLRARARLDVLSAQAT